MNRDRACGCMHHPIPVPQRHIRRHDAAQGGHYDLALTKPSISGDRRKLNDVVQNVLRLTTDSLAQTWRKPVTNASERNRPIYGPKRLSNGQRCRLALSLDERKRLTIVIKCCRRHLAPIEPEARRIFPLRNQIHTKMYYQRMFYRGFNESHRTGRRSTTPRSI